MLANKIVLIVDNDPLISRDIAESFFSKGYQVYIESTVEKGKRKLQVLQNTNSKLDIAVVSEDVGHLSSAFVKTLHDKYPNIKTIFLSNSTNEDNKSVLLPKTELKVLDAVETEAYDYSPDCFKEHIKTLRRNRRDLEVRGRVESTLKHFTPMTLDQLNEYNKLKTLAAKKLSVLLLDVYRTRPKSMRKKCWKAFIKQCEFYKYKMTKGKVFSTLRLFHTATNHEFLKRSSL